MNVHIGRTRSLLAVVSVLAMVATGCGSQDEAAEPEPGRDASGEPAETTSVVASTNVYGSVVEAVAGDRVEVTSLIDNANADPLEYETTAADAAAVSEAQLVIFNGNGYDSFMPQLIQAGGGNAEVIEVSELSGLRDAEGGDGEGEFNEHVFYDLATIQTLAEATARALGEVSPADAATFTENAAAFNEEIQGLRTELEAIAGDHQGARVAVTEPLPGYLLEEAGLENVAPDEFAEAIEEGNDPSAAVLAEMLALFGADPVEVLILNTQTQSAITDQVRQAAEAAGVPVVEMSETLTEPDYLTWMGGQIDALAEALAG